MKKIESFQKAQEEYDNGNLAEAKNLAKDILTQLPNHPSLIKLLAQICFEEENYEESLVYYKMAAKMYPEEIDFHYKLSEIYTHLQDNNKAIASLQQVLLLDPQHSNANQKLSKFE
jgi:predicted Zn-dependent protease